MGWAVVMPMMPALNPSTAKMPPGFFALNMGIMAAMGVSSRT